MLDLIARAATDPAGLDALAERLLAADGGALLLGAPGTGKSTLARRLGESLVHRGHAALCIGADPGSPGFGVPGAVCLGEWRDKAWVLRDLEALCSLDAGRFRLPLTHAVGRLLPRAGSARLIVDGPGVVRGVAGAELLSAMVELASIELVIRVAPAGEAPRLAAELEALDVTVLQVDAAQQARRPGKSARARARTRQWDAHLEHAPCHQIDLSSLAVIGTPPPREAQQQWRGRQLALLGENGQTLGLGEIEGLSGEQLCVRCRVDPASARALLVRDARRDPNGLLRTAGPDATAAVKYALPADLLPGVSAPGGPRPVVRAGAMTAALVNGVLGDPLLHVRLQHRRRSLLFDLGEAGRLTARIAHQVSDLFLSHAHLDHIAGFVWLIRSRIGDLPPLRVFGPPGIASNVAGFLAAIHWDRIGNRGPRFEVGEFDGHELQTIALQAGAPPGAVRTLPAPGGILVDEPELNVRAAVLDHGTPVLAFAIETERSFKVRKERLRASRLTPGPWLTRLKSLLACGESEALVQLPDGRDVSVSALADDLVLEAPGVKLAYATDLADTPDNRERVAALAARAHTLFCEASFRIEDEEQARRTGHLTTRACGRIAALAGAERLVPFHFSRRYEGELAAAYDEIRAEFSRTVTPPPDQMED